MDTSRYLACVFRSYEDGSLALQLTIDATDEVHSVPRMELENAGSNFLVP